VQHTADADDVAQIHDFGKRTGFLVHVQLNTPAHVLQYHEGTTVEHDATGHGNTDGSRLQLFLALFAVGLLQVFGIAVAAEGVGEGIARLTQSGKFFAALGDQAVFFLLHGLLHVVV
jgi:hypothetical protein